MKKFLFVDGIEDLDGLIEGALGLKGDPYGFVGLGRGKTLGLLFFNSSLRTRLSTQKAALYLGMDCIVMNFNQDSWQLEFEDGSIMNGSTSEHIKEAARVVSQYCDLIAVRAFPSLTDKAKDESEEVLLGFEKYATVPVINMESATEHPLQALTDAITITELKRRARPKVVLSWAPHPKALPQSVANSFASIMGKMDVDFVITHPEGYELNGKFTNNAVITHNQEEAFKGADFVYAKNWSSYTSYGKILHQNQDWMITPAKMKLTNSGQFMHCLPVRRNVVVSDAVLDSESSIVIEQSNNRTFAAQIVLKKILEHGT